MDAKRLCEILNHPSSKRVADGISPDTEWLAAQSGVRLVSKAGFTLGFMTVKDLAARFVTEAGAMYEMTIMYRKHACTCGVESSVESRDSMPEAVFALIQKLEVKDGKA